MTDKSCPCGCGADCSAHCWKTSEWVDEGKQFLKPTFGSDRTIWKGIKDLVRKLFTR